MGKAGRPNMSTIRAEGGGRVLKDVMEERTNGRESIMVNPIRTSKGGLGGSLWETSTGGTWTMLRELRLDVCWRI